MMSSMISSADRLAPPTMVFVPNLGEERICELREFLDKLDGGFVEPIDNQFMHQGRSGFLVRLVALLDNVPLRLYHLPSILPCTYSAAMTLKKIAAAWSSSCSPFIHCMKWRNADALARS